MKKIDGASDLRGYVEKYAEAVPWTGCWLWKGAINPQGYGLCGTRYVALAHRLSYEAFNGKFDKTKFVLHKCDVPTCVNPSHLYLGTHIENSADKMERRPHLAGPKHKDVCKRGHLRSGENLGDNRTCMACLRITSKAYYARKKQWQ